MAEKGKDPKGRKIFSININFSWLYFVILLGIGYLLFSNQRSSEPEKIEWTDVQEMIAQGDVAEITFVRNDFKGEVKVRPERLAKYSDKFRGGVPPRRAPQFYFLVSTKFDPEASFAELNARLTPVDRFKVVIRNEERMWMDILQALLPLLILIVFWVLMFR